MMIGPATLKSGMSALALLLLLSPMQIHAQTADTLSAQEAKQIAEEGYIYGLPIVMNYAIIQSPLITGRLGSGACRSTCS
jgi:hypothetical protein